MECILVLKLECVFLMLWEFTMLHNSHKESLTWSWETAQFCHPVFCVTLVLCWGWAINIIFQNNIQQPKLSQTEAAWAQPCPRRDRALSKWLTPHQDPGRSSSCFQRMTPKSYRTHINSKLHKVETSKPCRQCKWWSSFPATEDTKAHFLKEKAKKTSLKRKMKWMSNTWKERKKLKAQEVQKQSPAHQRTGGIKTCTQSPHLHTGSGNWPQRVGPWGHISLRLTWKGQANWKSCYQTALLLPK